MNVELARGKIDLSKVVSVRGQSLSKVEASISVNMTNGRVYYLELPLKDFDRTCKKRKTKW